MKLLFTIDSLQAGGAEKSTVDMIYHLAGQWEIIVVYFYAKHDLREVFESAPCKLMYIPLESGYKFIKGIKALTALIQTERIDLIVTSLYRSGIISRFAGKRTNTPVIDTIVNDGYSASKLAEFNGVHKLKFYSVKFLDKLTAGIPVSWISNSAAIATSMGKSLGLSQNKIKVIYRGRNTHNMPAWSMPGMTDGFHFVAAGRLVAQKGFADLIKAFANLYREMPRVKLTIYGEGPGRRDLETLLNELQINEQVSLPGRVPEVWKQFYKAHCFVLPSHYEGLSGVLIEALITGIPVIATDIPMNTEAAVSDASIHFSKMGDINDLYNTMKALVEDYKNIADQSSDTRVRAIQKFDLSSIAMLYNQALKEAVKTG